MVDWEVVAHFSINSVAASVGDNNLDGTGSSTQVLVVSWAIDDGERHIFLAIFSFQTGIGTVGPLAEQISSVSVSIVTAIVTDVGQVESIVGKHWRHGVSGKEASTGSV